MCISTSSCPLQFIIFPLLYFQARALREKYLARKAEESADTESVKEEAADKVGKLPEDQESTTGVVTGGASAVFPESTRAETPKFYEIPASFRPFIRYWDFCWLRSYLTMVSGVISSK